MNRNKLYLFVFFFCLTGYFWIGYHYNKAADFSIKKETTSFDFCLFSSLTGVPCPSCGMTRSVTSAAHGHWISSLQWHPLGILMFLAMLVFPPWIAWDVLRRKNTFLIFYQKTEKFFQQKPVAIVSIFVILAIWVMNLFRYL